MLIEKEDVGSKLEIKIEKIKKVKVNEERGLRIE